MLFCERRYLGRLIRQHYPHKLTGVSHVSRYPSYRPFCNQTVPDTRTDAPEISLLRDLAKQIKIPICCYRTFFTLVVLVGVHPKIGVFVQGQGRAPPAAGLTTWIHWGFWELIRLWRIKIWALPLAGYTTWRWNWPKGTFPDGHLLKCVSPWNKKNTETI